MRQRLIRIVTFIGGLYFFLRFVLPGDINGFQFARYNHEITNGFRAIGALTFGLGLINILLVHGSRLLFRRKGWFTSAALLFGLAFMLTVTIGEWLASARAAADADRLVMLREFAARIVADEKAGDSDPPYATRVALLLKNATLEVERVDQAARRENPAGDSAVMRGLRTELHAKINGLRGGLETISAGTAGPEALLPLAQQLSDVAATYRGILIEQHRAAVVSKLYTLLSDGLFMALGTAMFSLLAFYIASAAYRAFRIKSAESALMMTTALIVMLGQIPFGLWLWDGFPDVRMWLLTTPSTAARRAIEIGAAVAGLIMAFRMWFSVETQSFSRGER
ncbi:MAG: hypothetical protein QY326_04975 [Bdellovibrionota bacterium]|nr:MAG: hypothetical protein QY326_04975 [Bdellovibrionota bacterium]